MFKFRTKELSALEKLWEQDGINFAIIAGKHKIGKTTLLKQFTQNKPTIFFNVTEQTPIFNLSNLNRAIENAGFLGDTPHLQTIGETLNFLFRSATNEKFVLVIDDVDNLIRTDSTILPLLSKLQSTYGQTSNILLILSTSALVYMNKEIFDKKSLLGGSTKIFLEPLDFFDTCRLFKSREVDFLILAYAVFGGMHYTLQYMNEELSIKDNIIQNFFEEKSDLFTLPKSLITDDFNDMAKYASILTALAKMRIRRKEIVDYIDYPKDVSLYLNNLLTSNMIQSYQAYKRPETRFNTFFIKIPFVQFFFRYIPFLYNDIFHKNISYAIVQIMNDLCVYRDFIFKKVCLEWCRRKSGTDDFPIVINNVQISEDLNYHEPNNGYFDFALLSILILDTILSAASSKY